MDRLVKKIMYSFLFFFFLENNVYSFLENENADYDGPSFSRFFLPCFSFCCGESVNLYDEEQEFLIKEKKNSKLNGTSTISGFEQIPLELYGVIIGGLNELDSVHLSMTSKALRKRSAEFWEMYIRNAALEKWDPSILAIKVAYANQFLEEGKLEKAAKLGLPKAVSKLKYKAKQKNSAYGGNIYNTYRPVFFNIYVNKGFR